MDMGAFFRDYGTPFATAIAILNSVSSLFISQVFKDNPRARIVLVVISVGLSVLAVGGTFYSQYQIVSSAKAQNEERIAMKNLLGAAINECGALNAKQRTENEDDANAYINEGSAWIAKVSDLINRAYGQGEVDIFKSDAGIVIYGTPGHPNVRTRSEIVARAQRLNDLIQRVDTISMLPGFDPRNYKPK